MALVALVAEAIEAGPAQVQRDPEAETEYARLVLAPYDGASRKWLEGEDTQAVEVLVTAVEVQDIAGERATPTTLFSARLLTPFSTQACAQLSARRVFV